MLEWSIFCILFEPVSAYAAPPCELFFDHIYSLRVYGLLSYTSFMRRYFSHLYKAIANNTWLVFFVWKIRLPDFSFEMNDLLGKAVYMSKLSFVVVVEVGNLPSMDLDSELFFYRISSTRCLIMEPWVTYERQC